MPDVAADAAACPLLPQACPEFLEVDSKTATLLVRAFMSCLTVLSPVLSSVTFWFMSVSLVMMDPSRALTCSWLLLLMWVISLLRYWSCLRMHC